MENQDGFRFMDLPPELRMEILRYLLLVHRSGAFSPIAPFRHQYDYSQQGSPRLIKNDLVQTSILRVSQTIRKEAEQLLYNENRWYFAIGNTEQDKWDFLIKHSAQIRHLSIEFNTNPNAFPGREQDSTFPAGGCSAWGGATQAHDHELCRDTRFNWFLQWSLIGDMNLQTLDVKFVESGNHSKRGNAVMGSSTVI